MTSRADDLATQFEAINDQYLAAISACTDDQWRQTAPDDGRTVALVAHHMATVQQGMARILGAAVSDNGFTLSLSAADVERMNADHARDFASIGRAETLDALRTSRDEFARLVRSLTDDDLPRSVGVVAGYELTVGQMIEMAVIAHAADHLASIRGGIEG